MKFFKCYEKLTRKLFLFFQHEVNVKQSLKFDIYEFFGKSCFWARTGQIWSKIRFFEKNCHPEIFSLNKLQYYVNLRLTQTIFGKYLVLRFLGQKGTRNELRKRLFRYYENSVLGAFLISCIKLQQHNRLKLNKFKFWKKLCTKVIWPRGAHNGPKMWFYVL